MSMHRFGLACAALVLAGCGPKPTTTTVDGSVGAISFSKPYAVYGKEDPQGILGGRIYILISDNQFECSSLAATGLLSRSGVHAKTSDGPTADRIPSLFFELGDPGSTWRTEASIGDGLTANLDPGGVEAASWGSSRAPLITATIGALTLDQYDDPDTSGASAAGTFNAGFGTGTLSGTFVARPCKALQPGCSASGGGLALPLLWLLVRALRAPTSSSSGRARRAPSRATAPSSPA